MATSPPFDVRAAVADPGFTPGASHLPALFAWLADAPKDDAARVESVIARAGENALSVALETWKSSQGEARARVVALLGRLADPRAAPVLREALLDPEPRVRRRAASALGRLPAAPESERALASALEHAELAEQRVIAEALGKVGGPAARELLATLPKTDPELARRTENALLLLERRLTRDRESSIVSDRALPHPLCLVLRCRAGLAELLADELGTLGRARMTSASTVEIEFGGALDELFCARIALAWGFRVELARSGPATAAAVAAALESEQARSVLHSWTRGSPRFRLEFTSGGHQRARVFQIAKEITRKLPELVNDSRKASWSFVVVDDVPDPHLLLVPRGFEDPRFSYRKRGVRAASHPSVAAALARAAGVRADDRVWDPFVGSGLELVERALIGPYASLAGSDRDSEALDAARENLAAAHVRAELRQADARSHRPGPTTLILTNPPMGRRLVRDATLGSLLDRFVQHAAEVLEPGGRLVWLSPLPGQARARAHSSGLEILTGRPVDLGGFEAELQIFSKQRNRQGRLRRSSGDRY
jgi:hypothetical protein